MSSMYCFVCDSEKKFHVCYDKNIRSKEYSDGEIIKILQIKVQGQSLA